MALRQVNQRHRLIHHSDRGFQYGCQAFRELAERNGVQLSMTEEDHVYENAIAERINGILKDEFLLGETLVSHDMANKQVANAIEIYNDERLHTSLGYKTPSQVFIETCQLF